VGIRCVTGDPRSEALRRLEGRSPNIRGTFSECSDERGSVLEHRCEILSIHPEAVSGTLAVRMQRQEGRTSYGSVEAAGEVAFEVDSNTRDGESEVCIPIQPRHLFSPEAYDHSVVAGSEVTTLLHIQSSESYYSVSRKDR
jgi:hypothetical protein